MIEVSNAGYVCTDNEIHQSTDPLSLRERVGVRVMTQISRARQMRKRSTDAE